MMIERTVGLNIYIESHLRSQTSLIYITLPNIRHINYEDDIAVEDYIKPIFTTAIKYLLNDYYEEIQ